LPVDRRVAAQVGVAGPPRTKVTLREPSGAC
jgi:hypothetical protein